MNRIIKTFRGKVKDINTENFTATVIVSTKEIDRDNEIVPPESFKKRLKYYKEHPVLLSSHMAFGSLLKQIGEAHNVKIIEEGLEAKFEWYVGQGNQEADWAWVLTSKNIAAFSVSFIIHAYEDGDFEKEGYRRKYTDIELIEISQVLVPSNRNAVQSRRNISDAIENELCELAMKSFKDEEWPKKELSTVDKPVDVTDDYIRIRIREPDLFVDDSFRTIDLDKDKGIKAIIGKFKTDPDGSTHIQAVLFDKEKWTVEEAKKWVEDHKEDLKSFSKSIVKMSDDEMQKMREDLDKCMSDIENIKKRMDDLEKGKNGKHYSELLLGEGHKKDAIPVPTKEELIGVAKEVVTEIIKGG